MNKTSIISAKNESVPFKNSITWLADSGVEAESLMIRDSFKMLFDIHDSFVNVFILL